MHRVSPNILLWREFTMAKQLKSHSFQHLGNYSSEVKMSAQIASFYNDSLTKKFQNLKLLPADEVLKLEEEIELLREQVESLKQLLHQENHKIQEIMQELIDTKHELMRTNRELCYALQQNCRY